LKIRRYGMDKLVLGSPEAEELRLNDVRLQSWLARERPCPLCFEDEWDWDEEDEDMLPPDEHGADLDCPLCEGLGTVTGHQIEAYVLDFPAERRLLPSWWVSEMDVKHRETSQNGPKMLFEVR
jgi:hypothetical protein